MNHDEGGSLHVLVQAAVTWRKEMEEQKTMMTLRSFLQLKLLEELKTRLTQVTHPTEGAELRTTLESKTLMLKDQSWPCQRWNPISQQMETDPRKVLLTMGKFTSMLNELIDQTTAGTAVERFHSLAPLTDEYKKKHPVTPWRLQISLHNTEFYNLIGQLSYCACWSLVGIQMKPRSQTMGGPAKQLQQQMGLQPKGKGKGRGKPKGKAATST